MKKETKEKLKNVWIDASPFISVMGVAFAGVVYVYAKYSGEQATSYADFLESKKEDSRLTSRAHVAYLERKAQK